MFKIKFSPLSFLVITTSLSALPMFSEGEGTLELNEATHHTCPISNLSTSISAYSASKIQSPTENNNNSTRSPSELTAFQENQKSMDFINSAPNNRPSHLVNTPNESESSSSSTAGNMNGQSIEQIDSSGSSFVSLPHIALSQQEEAAEITLQERNIQVVHSNRAEIENGDPLANIDQRLIAAWMNARSEVNRKLAFANITGDNNASSASIPMPEDQKARLLMALEARLRQYNAIGNPPVWLNNPVAAALSYFESKSPILNWVSTMRGQARSSYASSSVSLEDKIAELTKAQEICLFTKDEALDEMRRLSTDSLPFHILDVQERMRKGLYEASVRSLRRISNQLETKEEDDLFEKAADGYTSIAYQCASDIYAYKDSIHFNREIRLAELPAPGILKDRSSEIPRITYLKSKRFECELLEHRGVLMKYAKSLPKGQTASNYQKLINLQKEELQLREELKTELFKHDINFNLTFLNSRYDYLFSPRLNIDAIEDNVEIALKEYTAANNSLTYAMSALALAKNTDLLRANTIEINGNITSCYDVLGMNDILTESVMVQQESEDSDENNLAALLIAAYHYNTAARIYRGIQRHISTTPLEEQDIAAEKSIEAAEEALAKRAGIQSSDGFFK